MLGSQCIKLYLGCIDLLSPINQKQTQQQSFGMMGKKPNGPDYIGLGEKNKTNGMVIVFVIQFPLFTFLYITERREGKRERE